ncbi:MAG TPA: phage major capsid protein [Stenotrophomonas sp.]|nr:phage major capsid protein [Stenotrophomonas sp.]
MNNNMSQHLEALERTREHHVSRRQKMLEYAQSQSRSLDDRESSEFDELTHTITRLDGDIARTKSTLRDMATARPVNPGPTLDLPVSPDGWMRSFATPRDTQSNADGIGFARVARCLAVGFLKHQDPVQIARSMYPSDDRVSREVTKAAVPAANTLSPTWAGNTIIEGGGSFADFVDYMTPRTVFGQISSRFRRLPFDAPVLVQGSGGTAQWVKEGEAKPLTQWTYTRTKLTPLKVAAIAVATQEMLMRTSVAGDEFLRDELARAVGRRFDATLVSSDAAVSDESPAGLLFGTDPIVLTGSGNVQGVRCDIAQFLKALIGDSLTVQGAFWIMPETVAVDLSLATNESGAPAFPGVTPTGGTLAGLPVFTSQYVPTDTSGSVVALVKGDEVFLGDEGGIQVAVSTEATLQMDTEPTQNSITPTATQGVSMFQTNSVAIRVERFVNWQKRRPGAVVWGYVNWDVCAE